MFEMLEGIYEPPGEAELEGSILSVSNDGGKMAPAAGAAAP